MHLIFITLLEQRPYFYCMCMYNDYHNKASITGSSRHWRLYLNMSNNNINSIINSIYYTYINLSSYCSCFFLYLVLFNLHFLINLSKYFLYLWISASATLQSDKMYCKVSLARADILCAAVIFS